MSIVMSIVMRMMVMSNGDEYDDEYGRVAHVGGARERRSTKSQGLLRKEGPPTYAILSRNLVLSRFKRFLKGFHRVFNKSHLAFVELSTKAILLSVFAERSGS